MSLQKGIQTKTFANDLNFDIDKLWKSQGSQPVVYTLPKNVEKVCFSEDEFEKDIKPTGFYKNKAKNIKTCANQIIEKHGGQVPLNMDELIGLAGVRRKTANVVMGDTLKKPQGIVVDTHVKRLSNRIGFLWNP